MDEPATFGTRSFDARLIEHADGHKAKLAADSVLTRARKEFDTADRDAGAEKFRERVKGIEPSFRFPPS
jgi:hypothetical protein